VHDTFATRGFKIQRGASQAECVVLTAQWVLAPRRRRRPPVIRIQELPLWAEVLPTRRVVSRARAHEPVRLEPTIGQDLGCRYVWRPVRMTPGSGTDHRIPVFRSLVKGRYPPVGVNPLAVSPFRLRICHSVRSTNSARDPHRDLSRRSCRTCRFSNAWPRGASQKPCRRLFNLASPEGLKAPRRH
jgi:hypothetical protein